MSIKIWTAYKLANPTDFPNIVHDIRIKATDETVSALKELYKSMMYRENITEQDEYKEKVKKGKQSDFSIRADIVQREINQGYRASQGSLQRSLFDFDVSIAFRFFEGNVYLIPFCDMMMRDVLNFLNEDPRFIDYHYQNQTDRTEGITDKDWKERERVWRAMINNNIWHDVLKLQICDYLSFYLIDPYMELLQENHEKNKSQNKVL